MRTSAVSCRFSFALIQSYPLIDNYIMIYLSWPNPFQLPASNLAKIGYNIQPTTPTTLDAVPRAGRLRKELPISSAGDIWRAASNILVVNWDHRPCIIGVGSSTGNPWVLTIRLDHEIWGVSIVNFPLKKSNECIDEEWWTHCWLLVNHRNSDNSVGKKMIKLQHEDWIDE